MATETTNYHFIKPGDTDPVDNTPLNQNFDSIDAAIAGHVADTNNPHQTTKEQVGLGNVDNTSDIDKPVSTAMQTALDAKVSHELYVPSGSILEYVDGLGVGFYTARQGYSTGTDKPISNGGFAYLIFVLSARTAQITAFETILQGTTATPDIFTALKVNGVWSTWYKQSGTPVASSTQSTKSAADTTETEGGEVR